MPGAFSGTIASEVGLAQAADFQAMFARAAQEGNALSYVSPKLFGQVRRIRELKSHLPAESLHGIKFILGDLPSPDRPLLTVRLNLPDGRVIQYP